MTQPSRILWSAVLFAATLHLSAPAAVRAQTSSGALKVTSFPSGANVSVDGTDTGKLTPMNISLAVGTHTVVVSIPNSGWNPDTRTVEVVAGNNDLSVTLLPILTTGPIGPPGQKGDTGATGATGAAGAPGAAATVTVGTVMNVPFGTPPSVMNGGTANAAILNFLIPQGQQGAMGLTGPAGPTGAAGPAGSGGGVPLAQSRAALLQWYPQQFAVTNPKGVAFDGTNIWVINLLSASLPAATKIRPSDGAVVGTVFYAADIGPAIPEGVVFDGSNLWVTSLNTNTVTIIRASDGTVLYTFFGVNGPMGAAFDGAHIWVATFDSVVEFSATGGGVLGTFALGCNARGVAFDGGQIFDGAHVWVTCFNTDEVVVVSASDGSIKSRIKVGTSPNGIAFDGSRIWVANSGTNTVTRLSSILTVVGGVLTPGCCSTAETTVAGHPDSVAFDGSQVWVTISDKARVQILNLDGTVAFSTSVGTTPAGLAFDGTNLWVVNSGSGTVSRVPK